MDKMRKLFESVDACADRLEELNNEFADLSSETTRNSVEAWRNLKVRVHAERGEEKRTHTPSETPDIREIAIDLLEKQGHGLEDVIDLLASDYNHSLTIKELVELVGKEVYISALRKDAGDLVDNSISYNQIASLWNDLDRPALGGENWTGQSVSILIE